MEVVTVEAARATTVGQTMHGVPIDEITIRSRVSYADLDLATAAGALELENRIRATAETSCRKIDVQFRRRGIERGGVHQERRRQRNAGSTQGHRGQAQDAVARRPTTPGRSIGMLRPGGRSSRCRPHRPPTGWK